MFPSSSTAIFSAAVTLGIPGIVMMSPVSATTNPAPADTREHAGDFRNPPAHRAAAVPQNSPVMFPSSSTSIFSAAGTLGSPGIVMMSPVSATTNPAPADTREHAWEF